MIMKTINKMIFIMVVIFMILFEIFVLIILFVYYGLPYPDDPNSIIPNYYLEQAVREQIGKLEGNILPEDCLGVEKLDLSASDYNTNLEGIQYFEDLIELSAHAGRIKDLSALSNLKKLKYLDLYKNEVEDLSPLSNIKSLESIFLYDNRVKDVLPLANLPNLKSVGLSKNPICSGYWRVHGNLDILREKNKEIRIGID